MTEPATRRLPDEPARPIRLYRGGFSGTIWATADYKVHGEDGLVAYKKSDVTADFDRIVSETQSRVPQVGVAAMLYDTRHRLLTLHRLSPHGTGTYSVPGGHQEIDESPEDTAVREMKEETGLDVRPAGRLGVTDTLFPSGLRYTTWFIAVHFKTPTALRDEQTLEGRYLTAYPEPANPEPDKQDEIGFRDLDTLFALPLFAPLAQFFAGQISPATSATRR